MQPNRQNARAVRKAAEMLAIEALGFIASEPQRLAGFLAATGIARERIRESAREPGFLAGVLEHMLGDETLVLAFTQSAGIDPAEVARASNALGGHRERDLP